MTCDHYCDYDVTLILILNLNEENKIKNKKKKKLNKEISVQASYVWHWAVFTTEDMLSASSFSQTIDVNEITKRNFLSF